MRAISENTLNILKSQKMTGQNKFNYQIALEGVEYFGDITDSKFNTVGGWSTNRAKMDFAVLSNGKVFLTYESGNNLFYKIIDSMEELQSVPNIGAGGTLFQALGHDTYNFHAVKRLKNGSLIFVVFSHGPGDGITPEKTIVYHSASGNADDFVPVVAYENYQVFTGTFYIERSRVSNIIEKENGEILFVAPIVTMILDRRECRDTLYRSTDGGFTWTRHSITGANSGNGSQQGLSSLSVNEETGFIAYNLIRDYGSVMGRLCWSLDNGVTWESTDSHLTNSQIAFDTDYKYIYMFVWSNGNIYRMEKRDYSRDSFNSFSNWELFHTGVNLPNRSFLDWLGFKITARGELVVMGKGNISSLIREEYNAPLQPVNISISKGKGGANTLDFSINNAGAIANPFNPDSPLFGIIGLNKQIILKQGYGGELVETFTGLIDSVKMRAGSDGYLMDIHARDALKYALDQTITEAGRHTVNFTNQPIETIFGYLCYLGGFETGDVQTTGIQISKEFTWTTYADAFQFLADLASFEYGADEYGKIYFRRDEQTPDSAVAYTFEEGVDIMGLSYSIDDNDLYNRVHVYGKSGDNVIQYIAPFLDAQEYGVFPQKVLKIDATEASTVAEIRKIAERAIYVMRSRAKRVEFEAVGVPWLQVGDFIGVYERSTMASGIYRITGLNSSMDNSGFTMRISAFYYGDSIVPGEIPETPGNQTPDANLNIIPEMTSNTTPEGIARASSVYTSAYAPWQAFNSHSNDLYWNAMASTGWIEYQFPEMMIVDKYMLKARQLELYNAAMPRDWKFEGFDGYEWVVLHTVTNQTSWGVYEERTFEFENQTPYAKYRLNVSRNNGYIRLQLEQLAFYYRGGV